MPHTTALRCHLATRLTLYRSRPFSLALEPFARTTLAVRWWARDVGFEIWRQFYMGIGLRDIPPCRPTPISYLPACCLAAAAVLLLPAPSQHGRERGIGLKIWRSSLFVRCDTTPTQRSLWCCRRSTSWHLSVSSSVKGERAKFFRIFLWTIHVIASPNTVISGLLQACELSQRAWTVFFFSCRIYLPISVCYFTVPDSQLFWPKLTFYPGDCLLYCYANGAKSWMTLSLFRVVLSQYPP